MKTFKQIISCILLIAFGTSAVFNGLFLLDKIGRELLQIGLVIVILTAFLVSLLGYILKIVRKEEVFPVNIITPAKELGVLYTGMLIIWAVTYFLALINR